MVQFTSDLVFEFELPCTNDDHPPGSISVPVFCVSFPALGRLLSGQQEEVVISVTKQSGWVGWPCSGPACPRRGMLIGESRFQLVTTCFGK